MLEVVVSSLQSFGPMEAPPHAAVFIQEHLPMLLHPLLHLHTHRVENRVGAVVHTQSSTHTHRV